MIDIHAETSQDRRPGIVICAYDVGGCDWDFAEDLSGQLWNPAGARTIAVPAGEPSALVETLSRHIADADCRGLLLVGLNRHSSLFRIQMRAENRGLEPGFVPLQQSPSIARATAPAAGMVQALQDIGLSADATSDGEDDVGSYLLYRILCALPEGIDVPSVGLLRIPGDAEPEVVEQGIKAVAGVIARHMSPLPRARHS
jgi:hypothetical protein